MHKAIGFTGTRHGLKPPQQATLYRILESAKKLVPDICLHHGDCVGADAEAHAICVDLGIPCVIHPPTETRLQAHCSTGDTTLKEPKAYKDRNEDIVKATGFLIACPDGYSMILRSGTWATVRYALKQKIAVLFIYPDGSIQPDQKPPY